MKTHLEADKSIINYDITGLDHDILKKMHYYLLLSRVFEERMAILLRQGQISKWFSGMGQEAISVGSALAQRQDEFYLTLIRNLPVFLIKGVPLKKLILQIQGKKGGFTKGRDRSFHFGTLEHHIVGMISHLGPQLSVACGVALSHKLKKEKKAVIVVTGDGATSEGEFHEALNLASVWELPVLFIIENNQWAISTPPHEQYRIKRLSERGAAYGMPFSTIDGNNVVEVYKTVSGILAKMREEPFPYLLECMTYRMRGHEEASGTSYMPPHELEMWKKRDPLINFENFLIEEGIISREYADKLKNELVEMVRKAADEAIKEPPIQPSTEEELADVYAPHTQPPHKTYIYVPTNHTDREMRFVDAIREAHFIAMEKWNDLIIMGQDIAEYGGVFKVTEGLVHKFGKERVRNTPLCESAIVGCALGLSVNGMRSIVEMQYADFASNAVTQIINNLAKCHYRWGHAPNVVIRMPTGAGISAGPFHSQSLEALFFHIPGLKILYPSTPADAKGLLLAAINDPNPCLFFEHKKMYRTIKGKVPEGYYEVEIGKARVVSQGSDIAIITYGMGVWWALTFMEKHPEISIYLLDLRTLLPMDYDAIYEAVRSTGKVLILHEDTLTGGIGAEISARIMENCFEYLDAPVVRCASLDTPVPFSTPLEENFLPTSRLEKTIIDLYNY